MPGTGTPEPGAFRRDFARLVELLQPRTWWPLMWWSWLQGWISVGSVPPPCDLQPAAQPRGELMPAKGSCWLSAGGTRGNSGARGVQ